MRLFQNRLSAHVASNQSRRGVALAAAISMLSLLGVLLIVLLDGTAQQSKWTEETERDHEVDRVAEAAINLAADRLWTGFKLAYGPDNLQPWNFRTYMDDIGVLDQAGIANPIASDFLASVGLTADAEGNYPLAGGYVQNLQLVREDEWDSSRVIISVSASLSSDAGQGLGKNQTQASEAFQVERPEWQGLDYALLANNVNCIMCHANIDDAQRFYNQDPGVRGSFNRVRVGSLESFHVREDPESMIAGTLYLGGRALQANGSNLTNWSGLSLKSAAFDAGAKLIEDAFGSLTSMNLNPADMSNPSAGENLYLDYLSAGATAQVDGELPDYFPSPFPDNGGFDPDTGLATPGLADNRILDRNEFIAATGSANGSIAGGSVAVVPQGDSLTSVAQFDSAMIAGGSTLGSMTEGNVILHGTELNPIIIDGPIAIDGDLVLSGYIKGRGAIMASGNVFIPSEIQFLDGSDGSGARTYGVATDGTVNSLGLSSGGNITIGDPSHPALGQGVPVDGTPGTPFNFLMDEVAIFNRGEWMKTQAQLPGRAVYQVTGTETVSVLITPTKKVTVIEPKDIYQNQPTGNMITEDVYGWVQTGTKTVDDYNTIHHPADPPAPYGSPWTERVWVGTHTEPVMSWQKTGTRQVPEMASVYIRTDQVSRLVTVPDGDPYYEDQIKDIKEWVTPMLANPFFEGVSFIPRYYAFSDNTPVPIFNKQGYFDPAGEVWRSAERAEDWDTGRLTLADPTDTADPILFHDSGAPKAVISTINPSQGWLAGDVLADLVDRELSSRSSSDPVAIDATLYSGNSLFGVVPARGQNGVSGRLLVNGGLVAADVGLLAPKGIQLNYDPRNRDLLDVSDDRRLVMRRALWAPSPRP